MSESLEAVTRTALALGLDAAALRQQAIAANIANANAPGWVPLRVDFEAQLAEARRSFNERGALDGSTLARVQPHIVPATDTAAGPDGSSAVRLDVEAADMAQNAVRYQALAKGLSRHLAILAMAAGDGRK